MRSRTVFRQLSLLLCLFLLFALAGCKQNPDKAGATDGETAKGGDQNAERPEAPAGQNQGGGGKRGAKAHMTLAGAVQFDGDVAMACNIYSEKGLEFTFDQTETRAPQVQLRIPNIANDGEYQATVIVREHPESGAVREWNGSAKVNLKSHVFGGARKRSGFNGNFTGTYQGQGGTGTLNGNFRRCILKDLTQDATQTQSQ
jgi:hypothetical protein